MGFLHYPRFPKENISLVYDILTSVDKTTSTRMTSCPMTKDDESILILNKLRGVLLKIIQEAIKQLSITTEGNMRQIDNTSQMISIFKRYMMILVELKTIVIKKSC